MPEEFKNETTNAVLKEMIIGLTKITDDRLLNLKEGVGEIKLLMQGFATIIQLEEVRKDMDRKIDESNKNYNASIKRIEDGLAEHNKADVISFGTLKKGQEDLATGQNSLSTKVAVIVAIGAVGGAMLGWVVPFLIQKLFG